MHTDNFTLIMAGATRVFGVVATMTGFTGIDLFISML